MLADLPSPWQKVLNTVRDWARINSPWAIHYNSGSCNGCDIEILATLTRVMTWNDLASNCREARGTRMFCL